MIPQVHNSEAKTTMLKAISFHIEVHIARTTTNWLTEWTNVWPRMQHDLKISTTNLPKLLELIHSRGT